MRKIYSLIAIAAAGSMVFSASAINRQHASSMRIGGKAQAVKTVEANPFNSQVDASVVSITKVGAPAKAAAFKSVEEMAGEWTVNYTGLLQNQSGPQTASWEMTVTDASKGEVSVVINSKFAGFKATVDLAKGTFTIANKQKLGADQDGDVYLYFKTADETGNLVAGASSETSVAGTIDGNTIVMPELNIWALGDPNAENLGWYLLGYAFSYKKANAGGGTFAKIEDFAGSYNITYKNLLNQGGTSMPLVAEVTDAAKGEVSFTLPLQAATAPFKAYVDLEKRTFTVANMQLVGKDSDGDIYLYFKEADATGNIIDGASSAANAVGEITGNTIVMPQMNIWALGDPKGEDLGWYLLAYNVVFTNEDLQGGDSDEGWSDFCTAQLTDGWILPALGNQVSNAPWTVNVQINDKDPKLFRLNNPYSASGSPIAAFSQIVDAKGGYINFNINELDFVQVIPNVYSGVKNGTQKLYFTNLEGYYVSQGFTSDVIKQNIKDITVWSTYTKADKTLNIPTCRFQIAIDGEPYVWHDENKNSLAAKMVSKLVFSKDLTDLSGIEAIDVDENAPVVYYNLQGIRVDNPTKGQLVIVRKGNKSYKMIAR